MNRRRVAVGPDIELDVVDAGPADGPLVVLLHGFPESSHSWRHQIGPLAEAGWRVIAPDQRGYGGSSRPGDVAAYAGDHLAADVMGLLDDVGAERAVIVGHDWGALLAWHIGRTLPERCRAVIAASVPFNDWPAPPIEVFRFLHGDNFFYILYFQEPGVAEAELDADPERFLRSIIWAADGVVEDGLVSPLPAEGTKLTQSFEHVLGRVPDDLPAWLSDAEFDGWVAPFRTGGFFGPVSWYRHFDTNYERTKDIATDVYSMPTAFVAGAADPVVARRPELVDAMATTLPNHLDSHLIPGAGHWVQQSAPAEFNEWLLGILDRI